MRNAFKCFLAILPCLLVAGQASAAGPYDDLLKWIERVKCARTHPNFCRGRPAKRRNTTGERMIGRDEEGQPTGHLERARGGWRKFIVRFGIHVIEVAKNPQLIVADFLLESRIPARALLLRVRS